MSQIVRPAFEQFASKLGRRGLGAIVGTSERGCSADIAVAPERGVAFHPSMSVSPEERIVTADFPEMDEPCAGLSDGTLTIGRIVAALDESFLRWVARLDDATTDEPAEA